MMKKILITIGKGQFSDQQIRELEAKVAGHYRQHVGSAKPLIFWNLVPQGNGYNDREERQSSLLILECEAGFTQEKRIKAFKAITDDWLAITGQHIDHLIIAIYESETFKDVLQRNARQLTTLGKVKLFSNMLAGIGFSRLTKGYNAFSSSF